MAEASSSIFQEIGVWIAIAAPLLYLIVVGSFLAVVIALLIGKRKIND